jgi:hypothetical protein
MRKYKLAKEKNIN